MILQTNSREFTEKLKKLRGACDLKFQDVLKWHMIYFLAKTAERTPVSVFEQDDPGRAQGSWTISRNQPGSFVIPKGQQSSTEEALARASSIQFANPYAPWYLYNRVPYAVALEFGLYPGNGPRTSGGFSTQAPAGMLRITKEELHAELAEITKNVR